MNPLERFGEYAAEFEKTFDDDNWARLEPYFHEDLSYVVTGTSYDCDIHGRGAVLVALKKALDGFDRRFDRREVAAAGEPVVSANSVAFAALCTYEKEGIETLSFTLTETAEYDNAGLIVRLVDDYPLGQQQKDDWLVIHQAAFDPSYE